MICNNDYDIETTTLTSVTTRVSLTLSDCFEQVASGSFSKNSCNVQRITRKCNANEKLTITHIPEVKMIV